MTPLFLLSTILGFASLVLPQPTASVAIPFILKEVPQNSAWEVCRELHPEDKTRGCNLTPGPTDGPFCSCWSLGLSIEYKMTQKILEAVQNHYTNLDKFKEVSKTCSSLCAVYVNSMHGLNENSRSGFQSSCYHKCITKVGPAEYKDIFDTKI